MDESSEDPRAFREDGPLASDIRSPRTIRPGTRIFLAMTGAYEIWRLSRVGLTLDDAIDEEMADYRLGLRGVKEDQADAYAASEPDVGLWEGGRCLAVIRPRVGGEPEVTRFDGVDDLRPLPQPSTEAERFVWGLVKEYGASKCHQAIAEKVLHGYGKPPDPGLPAPLSAAEKAILDLIRTVGEKDACDRLFLAGPYGFIRDAIERLGGEAFHHLRNLARNAEDDRIVCSFPED